MLSLQKDRVLADRYRLERAMGKGGMGHVWLARHLQLDSEVAVKFMGAALNDVPEMRARFEREAKAAAMLRSPNVVQVYDYGVEEGTPYIVMELLEGEDLQARLKREARLTPAETAKIVVQLCKALRRAHEAGLVHRDLKPANVFLAQVGDEQVVKILDFGIVKATGSVLPGLRTNGHLLMGSPQYMAPEQVFDSMSVDHRADLWALAVIAYRCLVGRAPFVSKNLVDLITEIRTTAAPLPSSLAPGLGADLDRFFARALSRDPAGRFQSALAFAEAFVALDWRAPEPAADEVEEAETIVRPAPAAAAASFGMPIVPMPIVPLGPPSSPGSEPTGANTPGPAIVCLAPASPATPAPASADEDASPDLESSRPVMLSRPARAPVPRRRWATALAAAAALVLGAATFSIRAAPAGPFVSRIAASKAAPQPPQEEKAAPAASTSADAGAGEKSASPSLAHAGVTAPAADAGAPVSRAQRAAPLPDPNDPYAEIDPDDPYGSL